MDKFSTCPFCGGEVRFEYSHRHNRKWWGQCSTCEMWFGYEEEEYFDEFMNMYLMMKPRFVDAWNHRAECFRLESKLRAAEDALTKIRGAGGEYTDSIVAQHFDKCKESVEGQEIAKNDVLGWQRLSLPELSFYRGSGAA